MALNPDIFISYSSKDKLLIDSVASALKNNGYSVWTDSSIEREWKPEIDEALEASSLVVVAVTPNSMTSAYVTYEWSRAWFGLNRLPYFLHLRETSGGMATRLRDDFQFHPSRAYLEESEERLLTADELLKVVQQIKKELEQLKVLQEAKNILIDAHSDAPDQVNAAYNLSKVEKPMREVAGQYLLQGLKHQLTSRGYGPVQVAILDALERIGEIKSFPYLWKLRFHTSDSEVQTKLDSVARTLVTKID